MMNVDEMTIPELIQQLNERRWTDVAIAVELETTSMTVGRWRRGDGNIHLGKLIRPALQELLARP